MGYDLINMLQDRILIFDDAGNAFDAPGNLGTGKHYFATLTVDAPLNFVRKGLRAKFNGTLQRSRVDDPISGDPRKFSGFYPTWQWELNVRRDSGRYSYGFDINDNQRFTFYRTDEFDTNFNRGPYMTAFVEFRPSAQTAINFSVENALSTHAARDRLLFRPNRAEPDVVLNEFRDRNRHRSFRSPKPELRRVFRHQVRTNRKAVGGGTNALQKRQCKISEVRLRPPRPLSGA